MKRRREKTGRRQGVQLVTLCISTAMVLVLLGLVVFSVQTSRNLSQWVKENLTVTVVLNDEVSVGDAKQFQQDLIHRPFSKDIHYISREQALKEQTEAMGSDPSEFLGMNPFPATLELQLHSDYANADSLVWISEELSISFSLINNTVRLSVYSRRFLIHTMKLVGASWGFIRRPFMKQGLLVGILAALIAIIVLGSGVYGLYYYEPGIQFIITWRELVITGLAVLVFGLVITLTCSYISVNRFLRMPPGELYKI